MKLIETYKSPNFDKRANITSVKYIILHYTAMTNHLNSIEHMCSTDNKVSTHFLVNKKGEIYYLVNVNNRAWHAGKSYWKGLTDINSASIGIEMDNSGHHINFENFTKFQIKSLLDLVKHLVEEYRICPHNILGHSDIAPDRKKDPGEKFPWAQLNKKQLSYCPEINVQMNENKTEKIKKNFFSNNLKKKVLFFLKKIGYDTRKIEINSKDFNKLIENYQRHYRQTIISGEIDYQTYQLINQHYKDVLTL